MPGNRGRSAGLEKAVLEKSESAEWGSAVEEWEIVGFGEDPTRGQKCVCGHDSLRHLFTIRNRLNGNELHPIGSTCIKKFERKELDDGVKVRLQALKLMNEAERLGRGSRVDIKSGYFTSDLISYMFNDGAFNGERDAPGSSAGRMVVLDRVFWTRNPTEEDLRKADDIIGQYVYPWLRNLWRNTHWQTRPT